MTPEGTPHRRRVRNVRRVGSSSPLLRSTEWYAAAARRFSGSPARGFVLVRERLALELVGWAEVEEARQIVQRVAAFDEEFRIGQVGCGQLVYHRDNRVVSIEGDPQSPISRGHLCPKGSASYELVTHPARATKVKYRAPRSRTWVELDLQSAVDMVADRMWTSRERTFDETHMHTTGIAHLGGATLDIEENYLIKKLFTAGLGMVCLSNQARI
jgi:formate dehydrogenase major subunit